MGFFAVLPKADDWVRVHPPRAQLALHKGTDKSVKGATYVAYFATRVAEGSEILMSTPALE